MSVTLAHKICLDPTFKQEEYFRKACGTARFTWNWALGEWKKQYESGDKPTAFKLKKQFNEIKKVDFPWTYDVTKYACQQPFIFLQSAFNSLREPAVIPDLRRKATTTAFILVMISLKSMVIASKFLNWAR